MNPAILVPVYNHGNAFRTLVRKLRQYDRPIIVVDDGSERETRDILADIDRRHSDIHTLYLNQNHGKGRAVQTGLEYAREAGFTHAIQIDADDQHNPSDIPLLLEKTSSHPRSLILTVPQFDDSMPAHRFYFRYLTHVWVWIETMSFDIPDALCGFRVYPVEQTLELCRKHVIGPRMEFDPNIAIRFYWEWGNIQTVRTNVTYHEEIDSNYNPFSDTVRISWMHCRNVLGMLYRLPRLLRRSVQTPPPSQDTH